MSKAKIKRTIIILYDFVTIFSAWIGAFWVRDNFASLKFLHHSWQYFPYVFVIQGICFVWFGLYRGTWRFASLPDLIRICKSVLVGSVFILLMIYYVHYWLVRNSSVLPHSIIPIYALLLVFLLGGTRLCFRWCKEHNSQKNYAQRALIVGAGYAGEMLARDLLRDNQKRYFPAGYIDDDKNKIGLDILGIRVLGASINIPEIVMKNKVDQVFLAIPSAPAKAIQRIVAMCSAAKIPCRTLPGLSEIAGGDVSINMLRDISLEDLLGRDAINLDDTSLYEEFSKKCILVTGAGGSIGSELCRQLAHFNPRTLVCVDHNEFNLYGIEQELREKYPNLNVHFHLLDVKDEMSINQVFSEELPNLIFHAAAYKHVPLLEPQINVAIRNNFFGTKVLATAAAKYNVEKFILISTDKAVNPANIMGVSKRLAEMYCQNYNGQVETQFITVRFGNVLGSTGSVVPLFRKQIEQGGPITITHPEITRYFMTITEASQLIMQAARIGNGGEIFVLDMGSPIKIVFLAEQMIRLSGKKSNDDIEIKYIGLRPGEKLYEELFHDKENLMTTDNSKILQAESRTISWEKLLQKVSHLDHAIVENDSQRFKSIIDELIPGNQWRQH